MRRTVGIALAATSLLASCGPTPLQRRACDMFVEAGGEISESPEVMLKFFSDPKIIASNKATSDAEDAKNANKNVLKNMTPQDWVDSTVVYYEQKKVEGSAVVSARLTISLREM